MSTKFATVHVLATLIKGSFMAYENSPIFSDETEGIKFFCTCGESAKKPYCDGSHSSKNTGKLPKECVIEEARRYVICDCGRTGNSPFCDGTHSKT
jgi:CDGSH iron-sulfur domain-containing protein 3